MASTKKTSTKAAAELSEPAETAADEPKATERDTAPVYVQFPSLDGDRPAEVEHRGGADSGGDEFRMRFVLLGDFTDAEHPAHVVNAGRVVEDALQRGLHPKEQARLVSAELVDEVRGKRSTVAIYGVRVVPAAVDDDVASTVTSAPAPAPEG